MVSVKRSPLRIGQFYSTIFKNYISSGVTNEWWPPLQPKTEFGALERNMLLWSDLQEILLTIAPSNRNMKAYGHRMRRFIMICASEVETEFLDMFQRNCEVRGATLKKKLDMSDFRKLEPLVHFSDFTVTFSQFEDLGPFRPFGGFAGGKLDWWGAHNKLKHDMPSSFERASLENCINAFSAVLVMLNAKYDSRLVRSTVWPISEFRVARSARRPPEDSYFDDGTDDWKCVPFEI